MIRMYHTSIGYGYLSMEDNPIFHSDKGHKYKYSDKFPKYNANVGYLHKLDNVSYTDEQLAWIHNYIVDVHVNNLTGWHFGASFRTKSQYDEIESISDGKIKWNRRIRV